MSVPSDKVFINIAKYGNMSAATILVAFVEAIEDGMVKPNSTVLMPAFGGGLTWSSHIVKFGSRTTPIAESDVQLPASDKSGLDIVNEIRAIKAEN